MRRQNQTALPTKESINFLTAYPLELASSLVHFLHSQHNNTKIGSFIATQTPDLLFHKYIHNIQQVSSSGDSFKLYVVNTYQKPTLEAAHTLRSH
jgi:hypothetical protein